MSERSLRNEASGTTRGTDTDHDQLTAPTPPATPPTLPPQAFATDQLVVDPDGAVTRRLAELTTRRNAAVPSEVYCSQAALEAIRTDWAAMHRLATSDITVHRTTIPDGTTPVAIGRESTVITTGPDGNPATITADRRDFDLAGQGYDAVFDTAERVELDAPFEPLSTELPAVASDLKDALEGVRTLGTDGDPLGLPAAVIAVAARHELLAKELKQSLEDAGYCSVGTVNDRLKTLENADAIERIKIDRNRVGRPPYRLAPAPALADLPLWELLPAARALVGGEER